MSRSSWTWTSSPQSVGGPGGGDAEAEEPSGEIDTEFVFDVSRHGPYLHDFGAGTLDERYTGGRNLNMWIGGSCHTQHLEKNFSSRTRHKDGFPRG